MPKRKTMNGEVLDQALTAIKARAGAELCGQCGRRRDEHHEFSTDGPYKSANQYDAAIRRSGRRCF